MRNDEMNPFEKLLVELAAAKVSFVTVDGVACAFNGYVRATEDVDILVSADPVNLARVLDVLKGFGDGHAAELTVADFPVEPGAIRIIEEFPLNIFTVMMDYRFEDLADHIRWFRTTCFSDAAVCFMPGGACCTVVGDCFMGGDACFSRLGACFTGDGDCCATFDPPE